MMRQTWGFLAGWIACTQIASAAPPKVSFAEHVAPVLSEHCLGCHSNQNAEGNLSFSNEASLQKGGDSGPVVAPGKPSESLLLEMISGDSPEMPKDADPLSPEQIATIRQWIAAGAPWPEGVTLRPPQVTDTDWWSLQPLQAPPLPSLSNDDTRWVRTPIDAFVIARQRAQGLAPSPQADRRTLIRRLYFDLLGLPPDFDAIERFVHDEDPLAYEHLVDRLLESPHYGERWARHWLDVVHYGDTHGYDKDKPRPNAWPYRDYVIRSLNEDKPYSRFVQEQIAGDVLWPQTRDGIEATGFIAAGPWDFIGHAEVPESKIDGKVARNLDRDDMVSSTMNTFISMTIQCARCHNHKFDPVTQEHYYSLQAVFAALDRADKSYDVDPATAQRRRKLTDEQTRLTRQRQQVQAEIQSCGGEPLETIDRELARLQNTQDFTERPEFGYHSQISDDAESPKWVQVDLGRTVALHELSLVACKDDFAGIGEGFGFPVRFKIELADDAEFSTDVITIADQTAADFPNPRCKPVVFSVPRGTSARFVRVTATKLAERQGDYIFALGELLARDASGTNVAFGRHVTSLDSIEAPVRWQQANLVDDYYYGIASDADTRQRIAKLQSQRIELLEHAVPAALLDQLRNIDRQLSDVAEQLAELPAQAMVYCGTVHTGSGAFRGTGHEGGRPREIHVLARGNVLSPVELVQPGTVPIIENVAWQFDLPADHAEGERRAALARWLVRYDNPLTWRSIVNRVWLYHFGRGLVDSPNDFGRMGQLPSHPQLLDWLAVHFRDAGQSIKDLHRMIVCSSVYRQASRDDPRFVEIDADNQFLWRMNHRVLDAEALRDAVLKVSGKLDERMFGPPFMDFVIERPEHSPHYEYHLHDPNDPASHRRSIYRFLVRSQQQPFMQTLDCADPSESVAKRITTLTSLQALAMLNNKFVVCMAEHFARRARAHATETGAQIDFIYREALGRRPDAVTAAELTAFAEQYGMEYACRIVLNLNEFVFID